jgi:Tfp pilus assembly protein PilV
VIIGTINLSTSAHQGFSYIEVLMSLLILSSGILGYAALMTRIQLVQLQSNQTLKTVLMMDYISTQLAISSEICSRIDDASKPEYSCQSQGVLVAGVQIGAFDRSSPLLEGYATADLHAINSATGLGCISFDGASMTYVIGLFSQAVSLKNAGACGDQANAFQAVTRYRVLPPRIADKNG